MKLSAIALKNLKRNFSFYSLYLFSVSFVLMIYFCFTSFSMNQIIMEKISSDGRVETMCRTVAVFIMAFVIFYMFYSNSFFMRRRMRELGIYSLLGYRKSTILKLLIFENVMICFDGMILGILTGSILHKIVIAGIVTLLGISVDQSAIPLIYPAAVKAILSFVIVVLITLTLSNASLLRKSTLLDLVRLEKKTEKPIHPHAITAILGVGFLSAGYGLSLDIMRGKQSLWNTIGFSPIAMLTLLCVVAGTIDINLGGLTNEDGLMLTQHLLERFPDQKIVILSGYNLPVYRKEAKRIGARGFISKDVEPDELLHILLTIKDGATHFPREEVFIEELTDGERKVLELVASGVRRREIAEQLFISERTVSNHLQHIFEKLQVSSTVEMITKAIKLGYIAQSVI